MFDATEVVPINFVFFTASAIVAGELTAFTPQYDSVLSGEGRVSVSNHREPLDPRSSMSPAPKVCFWAREKKIRRHRHLCLL